MEQVNTLNILQHNVRHWNTIRSSLSNTYKCLDPHIILINSHGCINDEKIKIFNYTLIQSNKTNTRHDGVAVGVRRGVRYGLVPGLSSETLAIKVGLAHEEVLPFRRH